MIQTITGSNIAATILKDSLKFSPQLKLQTAYVLNAQRRIVSMGPPDLGRGPLFSLMRDNKQCAWAIHADVPNDIAKKIEDLARQEPPVEDFEAAPVHAQTYLSLLGGRADSGPSFVFPDNLPQYPDLATIKDVNMLVKHLRGWEGSDIEGWLPIIAVVEDGQAVSACFSARRSAIAAEAGLNTAENWRGRGLAGQVTLAWAQAIRDEGLLPVYSTSWSNKESRAVVKKLGLTLVGSAWNVIL